MASCLCGRLKQVCEGVFGEMYMGIVHVWGGVYVWRWCVCERRCVCVGVVCVRGGVYVWRWCV